MFQTHDIVGNITLSVFSIQPLNYALGTGRSTIVLTYSAIANPGIFADLIGYEYTLDNGITWDIMTPAPGTVVTSLPFTPSGTTTVFEWDSKADIGYDMYNQYIPVRLIASDMTITTSPVIFSVYFERIVTDKTVKTTNSPFPFDYKGTPGNELLVKAPKVS